MENVTAFISHLLNDIPESISLQYLFEDKFLDVVELDYQYAYEVPHTGGLYSAPKPAVQLSNDVWLLISDLEGDKLRLNHIAS
ncbi:hypothetical protein QTP81_09850 [Alteromonas sp. ASW11-36]|uniref:Uncharacterized protein n=1 Tax=Alteromonas arenosi TaxID=3055817 RepID=A0ABT7SXK1_9ALTE|nr:hypothetical protein [Alteromonas sp. ASW11-36]MDM7860898.1 hypothetical protein [Alteromonas sp. ASW11-36]